MSLKLYANEHLSFPVGEANFVHSPTGLRVGGEQIIGVQRQVPACVLRLKLFCDIVCRDAQSRTRLWYSGSEHKLSYLRCAPVAAERFVFASSFDEQLQKTGSQGIVMAELWFHLARLGRPGGASYSVLLLPSQIAE